DYLGGLGPVIQDSGTTIRGEELSVNAGIGGISLGQGTAVLSVEVGDFTLSGGANSGDMILVNNTNGGINGAPPFILADLCNFSPGFSVFNPVGGAVIQTVGGPSGRMDVNSTVAVRDNLRLATRDVVNNSGGPNPGSDSINLNADVIADFVFGGLVPPDGVASTVEIWAGDSVRINGVSVIAEHRIDLRGAFNG